MRLIIYYRVKFNQEIKNLKILELNSSDINNNEENYYLEYNEIPVVKYSDTGETFVIKDFNNKFLRSINEISDIYISEDDLQSLSSSGGSGGNQGIQYVMENGDFYIGNMDTVRPTAFGMTPGRSGVALVKNGNGLNIVDGNGSLVLTDTDDNGTTTKVNFNLIEGQDIQYNFPSNKTSGSYTIATLDDIIVGNQNLDQTLSNGNESSYDINLKDDAGIYIFTAQFPEDEVASLYGTETSGRLVLNNIIDDSILINYLLPNPSQVGTGNFYLPVGYGDTRVLTTLEDINLQNTLTGGRSFTGEDGTTFGLGIPGVGFIYSSENEDSFILKNNDYFSLQVKNPTDNSIVNLFMKKLDNGKNLQFNLPTDKEAGDYTLAVKENVQKWVSDVTFNGSSTVFNIPHSLGSDITFADARRGAGTNFDVYNVTWDSKNIILTYENPPTAGTQSFNIRAEI